jgi:LGFP repeat
MNKITTNVTIAITDHENYSANEHSSTAFPKTFLLDAQATAIQQNLTAYCGGEVRVEVLLVCRQEPNGWINLFARALLYEGSSHDTSDLDGTTYFDKKLPPGHSQGIAFRVSNTDEGDDFADITIDVTNDVIAEPCESIDLKANVLGVGFTGVARSGCESIRGGRRKRFDGCDIYSSLEGGTKEIHGDIRMKYDFKNGPDSDEGLPTTDELTTPDGVGRYNHMSGNGSLYWTPSTGAMVVRGGIRHHWASTGWERGAYGYPISDEILVSTAPWQWFSDFQNGVISYVSESVANANSCTWSRAALVGAFEQLFRNRVRDMPITIDNFDLSNVSGTGKGFTRSRNRLLTFSIGAQLKSGSIILPDPNFYGTIEILIQTDAEPNGNIGANLLLGTVSSTYSVTQAYKDGFKREVADELLRRINSVFARPLPLTFGPEHQLLSAKIMADGALTLFFAPGENGQAAAMLFQSKLDSLTV